MTIARPWRCVKSRGATMTVWDHASHGSVAERVSLASQPLQHRTAAMLPLWARGTTLCLRSCVCSGVRYCLSPERARASKSTRSATHRLPAVTAVSPQCGDARRKLRAHLSGTARPILSPSLQRALRRETPSMKADPPDRSCLSAIGSVPGSITGKMTRAARYWRLSEGVTDYGGSASTRPLWAFESCSSPTGQTIGVNTDIEVPRCVGRRALRGRRSRPPQELTYSASSTISRSSIAPDRDAGARLRDLAPPSCLDPQPAKVTNNRPHPASQLARTAIPGSRAMDGMLRTTLALPLMAFLMIALAGAHAATAAHHALPLSHT